jgi:hypothetical protein
MADDDEALRLVTSRGDLNLVDVGGPPPGPGQPGAGRAASLGPAPARGNPGPYFSVRLKEVGPEPVELLDVLCRMGCPEDLAADYLGAAADGDQPQVLVGATVVDAERVAESLRQAGAIVWTEPYATEHDEGPERPGGSLPGLARNAGLSPVEVVERYLVAYNAGDQAGLMECLSATAVLADATGRVLIQGSEGIGRRMGEIFHHYPDRRVTVLGRMVAGSWVLEHHRTAFGASATEETIMCFRVDGASIARLVLLTMT